MVIACVVIILSQHPTRYCKQHFNSTQVRTGVLTSYILSLSFFLNH